MESLLLILIVLACPLMMVLMMRGHGHGSPHVGSDAPASSADLRRRRDQLDRLIEAREREERSR